MNHYEKENAKEWQLDVKRNPKPSTDKSDSDSDNNNDNAADLSNNRFAPISALTSNARTHAGNPAQSSKGRGPPATPKFAREDNKVAARRHPPGLRQSTTTSQRWSVNQPVDTGVHSTSSAAKPEVSAPARPSSRITFSSKKDNASKAAFRKGKVHDATFTLSKTCEKIEPDRSKMYARLEEIGVRFGSFVRPPQRLHDRILLVWGSEKQVAETIGELQHWVSLSGEGSLGVREAMSAKAEHEKYPKVGELQSKRDEKLDKRIKQAADMHVFQKDPADGQHFDFHGYFLWPANEVKPEELLGTNCEAFDPIRTYNHSHIVWEPQLSCFKVLSNVEAAMQNALERIEGTMKEWAARSSTTYNFNLVQPPEVSTLGENVKTVSGPTLDGRIKPSRIPIMTGNHPVGDSLRALTAEGKVLETTNKQKMQTSLRKVLERLQFFRGRVRMRVHFGTFVLDTIRWPGGAQTIPLRDFIASITNTATTTGVMLRDLQCQPKIDVLIGSLINSKGVFESLNILSDESGQVLTPIYTARFDFRSRETGNVMLEVELQKPLDRLAVYETSRAQWSRNDQTDVGSPLDVNVVQLTGGCSWRLHVSHNTPIDDTYITPRMADFASSVAYKAPPGEVRPEVTGCKVFTHAFNMQYESFEQKTALRFRNREHGAWVLEVARYDTFSPNVVTASSKTYWGASFWNTEWDSILGTNDNLSIGQAATWEPKFERFFPGIKSTNRLHQDGFQSFLDNITGISVVLDRMRSMPRDRSD